MTLTNGQDTAGSDRQQPLKTIPQAAAYLGKSERTVRRWVKAGKLQTVELAGQVYVQPDSLDRLASVAGATVETLSSDTQKQANMSGNVQVFTDKLEQVYKDRISGLESEVSWLRQDNQAKQATIDNLTRMLPPPKDPTPEKAKGAGNWFWILLLVLTAVAVLTFAYITFSRPSRGLPVVQPSKIRIERSIQALATSEQMGYEIPKGITDAKFC